MQPLVEWCDVTKVYGGAVPVHALHPTNITISGNDYVAIVGPSGSGKSTLLNLLGLLDRPSSGAYVLSGLDVAPLAEDIRTALRARFIGFVFQAFHLLPQLTVKENVEMGMMYSGVKSRERQESTVQVIEHVGMTHRINAFPTTLSGGERQRVAIARGLVNAPKMLLCDEPTGNLDTENAQQILELLESLHRQGTTVVTVTHDVTVASRAHRRLVIRDGHTVEEANVAS